MKKPFIPLAGPSITDKEVRYVAKAARDGWDENHEKYVNLFEKRFARYVGRKYALASANGTAALHLAFLALGIQKGDEVIVPNMSWIASVEPLYYMGAKPLFVDIDPRTQCISPADIEKKITKRTKAVLVVDLYGGMPEMNAIARIARAHRLFVVEDAAEAVGAEYHGKKAGSFGDVSCFSFHGSKMLVTGEGGMLLCDRKTLIEKARYYNDHCKDPKKIYWNLEIGYKYKMTNFQAACGLAQLERIKELIEKKRRIFSWYRKRLAPIRGIALNSELPHTKSSFWVAAVAWDNQYKIRKEEMVRQLERFGIQARPFFYPLSFLPAINEKADTPITFDISSRGVNLPSGFKITEGEVEYVCAKFVEILRKSV